MNSEPKKEDTVERALFRLCDELRDRGVAKLPAERSLAERLNSSRSSVRRILNSMEMSGELYRVRGRAGGAFLTGVPTTPPSPRGVPSVARGNRIVTRDLTRAEGVPQMLSSQGYNAGTQVVRAVLEKPTSSVEAAFDSGDVVISLVRIRYADGEALSLEQLYLPAARFPGLLHYPLNTSLYGLLEREYGVSIARTHEQIEVTLAPDNVAALLDCPPDAPLLRLTRETWDNEGEQVEYSVDLFRADRTRLTVDSDIPGPVDHTASAD